MAKRINKDLRDNITEYIRTRLADLQDETVREKQAALNPSIAKDKIIGVPTPALKRLAKSISEQAYLDFDTIMAVRAYLTTLPHQYLDEDMLHMLLLAQIRDFNKCMWYMDLFLPYVKSRAVVDLPLPTIFKENQWILFPSARRWSWADQSLTSYYGIRLLRELYMDRWFYERELDSVAETVSADEAVIEMAARYMTDALTKHWDLAIKVLEERRMTEAIHNKTLELARRSKLTKTQKAYVKSLEWEDKKVPKYDPGVLHVWQYGEWWWTAEA